MSVKACVTFLMHSTRALALFVPVIRAVPAVIASVARAAYRPVITRRHVREENERMFACRWPHRRRRYWRNRMLPTGGGLCARARKLTRGRYKAPESDVRWIRFYTVLDIRRTLRIVRCQDILLRPSSVRRRRGDAHPSASKRESRKYRSLCPRTCSATSFALRFLPAYCNAGVTSCVTTFLVEDPWQDQTKYSNLVSTIICML